VPGQDYDAGILILPPWTKDDIPDLLRILKTNWSSDRIKMAERELIALGADAKDAESELIAVLQSDEFEYLRPTAIRILAQIGSSSAVEALDAAANDADLDVHQAAVEGLKEIQGRVPSPTAKAAE
jgi:HEAT repeat protein